jgi:hypothetical protein
VIDMAYQMFSSGEHDIAEMIRQSTVRPVQNDGITAHRPVALAKKSKDLSCM